MSIQLELPLLPLRDVVIYPHMVMPLFVGRERSIHALEAAMAANKQVFLVAQRDASDKDPEREGLYEVGTISTILQLLKLPDGTVKVLVEGGMRASLLDLQQAQGYALAQVERQEMPALPEGEPEALAATLLEQFGSYVKLSKKIAPEVQSSVASIEDPSRVADTIAAHLSLKLEEKQSLLEQIALDARIEHLLGIMEAEMELLKVEKRIRGRVKKQMEKSQREYYLNEQMKAIQKELGELDEGHNELADVQSRIEAAGMPVEARKKVDAEMRKLRMMSPMSAEATVVRSYIDWMLQVPWKKRSRVRIDLKAARELLDRDHYGLDEVKERILEYLAVQSRVKRMQGPILCLVGPPGVGKTSLGQSIARATHREFVRMALGGVRDEAEIRGHRRTYIGSMPGRLIQRLSKVGVRNPLFLLDEVDKMGVDMRGDPASALLEVLDPEQNKAFNDHYLEVDYDLSEVMFICTANSMNIPGPLLDRMEVIRIPGYTEDEKIHIARRYLLPKQLQKNGLRAGELSVDDEALRAMIRYYSREAGVRALEREIAKICRKVVKSAALSPQQGSLCVGVDQLEDYLGVRRHSFGRAEEEDQVGLVTGLAWTAVGGDTLTIEAVATPGKGRVLKTGSLGDVMQESISAASTVVRARSRLLGIPLTLHDSRDLHVHIPEGATPKDGPSAGIAICTAIVSVLTGIAVRADIAMTGEITLRGQVLPIGGLKEKLLAAHRAGIKEVLIPEENMRDLKEVPDNIKQDLLIHPVKWIDQVLSHALVRPLQPLVEEALEVETPAAVVENEDDERLKTH